MLLFDSIYMKFGMEVEFVGINDFPKFGLTGLLVVQWELIQKI